MNNIPDKKQVSQCCGFVKSLATNTCLCDNPFIPAPIEEECKDKNGHQFLEFGKKCWKCGHSFISAPITDNVREWEKEVRNLVEEYSNQDIPQICKQIKDEIISIISSLLSQKDKQLAEKVDIIKEEIQGFIDLVESMGMDEKKWGIEAEGYNRAITIIKPSLINLQEKLL